MAGDYTMIKWSQEQLHAIPAHNERMGKRLGGKMVAGIGGPMWRCSVACPTCDQLWYGEEPGT